MPNINNPIRVGLKSTLDYFQKIELQKQNFNNLKLKQIIKREVKEKHLHKNYLQTDKEIIVF